jgi:hypothetical protein
MDRKAKGGIHAGTKWGRRIRQSLYARAAAVFLYGELVIYELERE